MTIPGVPWVWAGGRWPVGCHSRGSPREPPLSPWGYSRDFADEIRDTWGGRGGDNRTGLHLGNTSSELNPGIGKGGRNVQDYKLRLV